MNYILAKLPKAIRNFQRMDCICLFRQGFSYNTLDIKLVFFINCTELFLLFYEKIPLRKNKRSEFMALKKTLLKNFSPKNYSDHMILKSKCETHESYVNLIKVLFECVITEHLGVILWLYKFLSFVPLFSSTEYLLYTRQYAIFYFLRVKQMLCNSI